MSTTERRHDATRPESGGDALVSRASDEAPVQLRLLDDEYAREMLSLLAGGPMRGQAIIERCDASRATVYRRLDRLEAAGLVTAEMRLDADGHHCREFRLARDELRVTVEGGTVTVVARPS